MLSPKFIAAIVLLAVSTYAASSDSAPPFEITNLKLRKQALGNVTIEFTVYDPAPLTNSTAICSGSWAAGSKDYPQGPYERCGNSSFSWHMEQFKNIKSFELGIEHEYTDPAVGEPPFDKITNFGKTDVAEPAIVCTATSSIHLCNQDEGATIKAPVYATTAK